LIKDLFYQYIFTFKNPGSGCPLYLFSKTQLLPKQQTSKNKTLFPKQPFEKKKGCRFHPSRGLLLSSQHIFFNKIKAILILSKQIHLYIKRYLSTI